jgi:hypothetical protein
MGLPSAHRFKLVLARVTFIGFALGKEFMRHVAMTARARELIDNLIVPRDAEPFQPVENGGNRGIC